MRVALLALVAAWLVGMPLAGTATASRVRNSLTKSKPGTKPKSSSSDSTTSKRGSKARMPGSALGKKLRLRKSLLPLRKQRGKKDVSEAKAAKNHADTESRAANKRLRRMRKAERQARKKPGVRRRGVPVKRNPSDFKRKLGGNARSKPRLESVAARLLESDADALSARIDLINNARTEINLSAYIFSPDRVGFMMLASLRNAARRGVKVRVIVDALGSSKLPRALLDHLAHEGIEVSKYNEPSLTRIASLLGVSRRMHDKLLIVDGWSMVLGARNTDEGYFGGTKPGYAKFLNTDAFVEGASATNAKNYFQRVWSGRQVTAHKLAASARNPDVESWATTLDHWGRVLARRSTKATDWRLRARVVGLGRFVHDPTTTLNARGGVHHDVMDLLDSAKGSIDIQTPYLVPTRRLLRALKRATDRGVKVTIQTNSLKTIDNKIAQYAYEGQLSRLAKTGVTIYEYEGKLGLHSKGVTIDGRLSYIGSYNFDPRSAVLNKEVGVVVVSKDFAKQMLDHSGSLRFSSRLVVDRGRITSLKRQTCGIACRSFAKLLAPILRLTGLYTQI